MLGMIRVIRVGVTEYRLGNQKLMTPLPHAILTRASCPPHAAAPSIPWGMLIAIRVRKHEN